MLEIIKGSYINIVGKPYDGPTVARNLQKRACSCWCQQFLRSANAIGIDIRHIQYTIYKHTMSFISPVIINWDVCHTSQFIITGDINDRYQRGSCYIRLSNFQ